MTKTPLLEKLKGQVLVANGAMGTMLAAAGVRLSNSAQANLDHPEIVRDIFRQYAAAGATVFQSNTFAANETMLKHAGLADRHDEANELGFSLVREVVPADSYVAANIGPCGEMLRPLGLATAEEVAAVFERQARVLLALEPDLVLLETFEALEELEAAVAGVRAAGLNVPLAITFSFSQPSGRSMMGVSPRQAAEKIVALGADLIGANCGLPEVTIAALRDMVEVTDLPLMVQANAGLPELRAGEACFSGSPEDSAQLAVEAARIGARIVGGCCGTNPSHVRAMAQALVSHE
ncbi:MAG: homocysteine S-methyltransferase family protein [Armatimonadota bacterium]